jgi:Recombinase zinc beta ribbon domain
VFRRLLDGHQYGRRAKHDLTYSGLVVRGHCGCAMVGEIKKQRYVYYHCTGYRQRCPEPYTREELLTTRVIAHLGDLVIPKPVTDWLRAALSQSDVAERRAREQSLARAQAEHDRLATRLEAISWTVESTRRSMTRRLRPGDPRRLRCRSRLQNCERRATASWMRSTRSKSQVLIARGSLSNHRKNSGGYSAWCWSAPPGAMVS